MPLPQEERYTLADALDWPEKLRIELIEGEPVMMSPPKRIHQEVSVALASQLYDFLKDKKCKVFPAPFAVRLFEQDGDTPKDVDTMVEPDITVVCDSDKLDELGCKGAPDFVIEILSSSTARYDRTIKYQLYQRAGVREYWIIDPGNKTVQVYTLENGRYNAGDVYLDGTKIPVGIWEDFSVDMSQVFTE